MFKKIAIVLSVLAVSAYALAAPISASYNYLDFSTTNVTSAYTQLFATPAVVKAVKGVLISNGSTQPVYMAVGVAGQENDNIVIPAGSGSAYSAAMVYYPMTVSQNQRISIRASVGTTISAGKFFIDLLYN